MKSKKKGLDPIVKMGLGILAGGFFLIAFGMFLSRPDRTIPPYSVGAQDGTHVAIHLPSWTSDPEIETLINRFGEVGRTTRDFGPMKIRPTTPGHKSGRYHTLSIIIFSDPSWAEPEVLHRYLENRENPAVDRSFIQEFEAAVRGGYLANGEGQSGWIGPWNRSGSKDRTLTMQWILEETRKKPDLSGKEPTAPGVSE